MAIPKNDNSTTFTTPALEMALQLLASGLWPVAIYPVGSTIQTDSGPKVANGKEPIGRAWGKSKHTAESLLAVFTKWPEAGVGIKLGADGTVVDIDVDDPAEAAPVLARIFPEGLPLTWGWSSTRGYHLIFQWDERLLKYDKNIVKGWLREGEVCGHPSYTGLEIRLGAAGGQLQSVVPPTVTDGHERVLNGNTEILPLPESFFTDLDKYVLAGPAPEPEPPLRVYSHLSQVPELATRVRAYLSKIEPAVAGQHGHDKTFGAACRVGPGFDLSPDVALAFLAEWNQGCQPPWSDKELERKVAEAYRVETRRGWLLEADRRPAEQNGQLRKTSAKVAQPEPEDDSPIIDTWPEQPDPIAYYGLAGDIVRAVEPTSEADPIALLIQLLIGFGNLIGRTAYFVAESDRHYCNEFAILVGRTSKGRKGSAWSQARRFLVRADQSWAQGRIFGGLSSGEGLIYAVRDRVMKREAIKERNRVTSYQEVEADSGEEDKRAMVVETEFGGTLKVAVREGSMLSAILRKAWDQGDLRTLTKNSPLRATNAHISIIGHVTDAELRRHLAEVDAANGFANRFLWLCVQRSKSLPFGGHIEQDTVDALRGRLLLAAEFARAQEQMFRDEQAEAIWGELYEPLAEGRPGLLGAILGRAEAHVMRLAMTYTLMDCSSRIQAEHLLAAMSLWDYCEKSARHIFGDDLGDPSADKLLDALRQAPLGLTRSEISLKVFGNNKASKDIRAILGRLMGHRLIYCETLTGSAGRAPEVWHFRNEGTKKPY